MTSLSVPADLQRPKHSPVVKLLVNRLIAVHLHKLYRQFQVAEG